MPRRPLTLDAPVIALRAEAPAQPVTAESTRAMRAAIVDIVAACRRYGAAYAADQRRPIGADPVLGPILLEVLCNVGALAGNDQRLREAVSDLVSEQALDLDE